jgi:hypothetical protein
VGHRDGSPGAQTSARERELEIGRAETGSHSPFEGRGRGDAPTRVGRGRGRCGCHDRASERLEVGDESADRWARHVSGSRGRAGAATDAGSVGLGRGPREGARGREEWAGREAGPLGRNGGRDVE